MSWLAVFNLSGGEIILILALVLLLAGAKRLPELGEGFRRGIREFRDTSRSAMEDLAAPESGRSGFGPPVLIVLTFILGATCLLLAFHEFSR